MTDPKGVLNAFLAKAATDEPRDIGGTPFKQDHMTANKDQAIRFMHKLYPGTRITVESMGDDGLVYYGEFSAGRRMIGNYSFEKRELWYKIYPGTKVPFHKP